MKNIILFILPFVVSALIFVPVIYYGNKRDAEIAKTPPPPQAAYAYESEVFKRGKRQLEMQGYKNVMPHSYPAFCCSKNESFMMSEGFSATDKDGASVTGCICIGKGFRNSVTIRFE